MQRIARVGRATGAVALLTLLVALGAVACSDDDTKSGESTSGVRTIAGCQLLAGANCAGDNLTGANLAGVNLAGANLATANLSSANLSNADLSGANLTAANLTGATMVDTDLSGANLTKANLTGANLQNVNLTDADSCGTIRTDGTIDNESCPQRGSPTTAPASGPTTTVATPTVTLACNQATFLQLFQSQATQYGVSPQDAQGATAGAAPKCAQTFASMLVRLPAGGGGEPQAFYAAMADRAAWQLVGVGSCSSVTIPPNQAAQVGC